MDPYLNNGKKQPPECKKLAIDAKVRVVLSSYREKRNLKLIQQCTRAVVLNEVHEIIITDEINIEPGSAVNRVAYFSFVEFIKSGVLMYGDLVKINNTVIGKLIGFDYTHMPNHMNIVIQSQKRKSGKDQAINLNDVISFTQS